MRSFPSETVSPSLADRVREFAVTCAFLGRVPRIPGTMGTLGGVAIAAALPSGAWFPLWALLAAALLAGLGAALAPWAERYYGKKDPTPFVLDETAGYLLTVCAAKPGWTAALLAFLLFRLLDIAKPFPARRLERLPSGAGIFLDDAVAAAYACILLSAFRALFPEV